MYILFNVICLRMWSGFYTLFTIHQGSTRVSTSIMGDYYVCLFVSVREIRSTIDPLGCSPLCAPGCVCVCVLVCEGWFERYKGSLPHSIGIRWENEWGTEQRKEGSTVGAFIGLVPTGRNQGRVLAPINKQSQPSRGLAHYTESAQGEKK